MSNSDNLFRLISTYTKASPLIVRCFCVVIATLLCATQALAVTIPAGTFYFDNSLTKYSQVKFVYGRDDRNESYIVSMTPHEGDIWKITFAESGDNMYRYTFAATTLPDGMIANTFSTLKNNISNARGEYRTATTDAQIIVGAVYTPTSGDNWAQGSWKLPQVSSYGYSGTLPVMFINTDSGNEITSRDEYVTATYYIDNLGLEGFSAIGSADAPLTLQVRGRGNYTWTGFDKKPYRLKFDAKAKPLGMNSSKHFVLLAHADDNMAFLRNTVGFELSRRLGLAYTPAQQPVELVINGSYRGLYMLTENIRIAKDRVNIFEMLDEATDDVTGGWLTEIDNYDDPAQIKLTEGNGETLRITYHSPEILSSEQEQFLTQQMNAINDAIYTSDKSSQEWEKLVDIDALARFYIVQEIMDNAESFHGSCYIHRDQGEDKKWTFGPVWDFGNSYHRGTNKFIYTDPPFGQSWIGEIAKFPRFQNTVTYLWRKFLGENYESLDAFINSFIAQISTAAAYDAQRWPSYGSSNVSGCTANFKNMLGQKVSWLTNQWGDANSIAVTEADAQATIYAQAGGIAIASESNIAQVVVYTTDGRVVASLAPNQPTCSISCPDGIYVVSVTLQGGKYIVNKAIVNSL